MDIHLVVQLRLLSQMMISHWRNIMGIEPISDEERDNMKRTITKPRPGHADLIGGMKYNHFKKCFRTFIGSRDSSTCCSRCSI